MKPKKTTACEHLAAFATLLCLAQPQHALAQANDTVGGPRTALDLRLLGYYTDNFFNEAEAKEAAYGSVAASTFTYHTESPKAEFSTSLTGEHGSFDVPGSQDDYFDGAGLLRLVVRPTLRNRIELSGSLQRGHDPFGVNRTEDATSRDDDLDRWNEVRGAVSYRYGAPGARINAEIGGNLASRDYVSNELVTQFLEYDAATASYALYYNYSPKTSALIDFTRTDIEFDVPFGAVDNRSGDLHRVRAGLRWLATAKTSGDVRVGYRRRSFESDAPKVEGADWEAGIEWSPVARTLVRLSTGRTEQQSYRSDARVIDIASATLNWKHTLSTRARSEIEIEQLQAEFEGSGRRDDIVSGSVRLEYLALSYLWVVASVGINDRASTVEEREYDRLNAYFGLRVGR